MKIIFLVLLCVLFPLNVFGQSEETENAEVGVEEISLARDDGNGKAGEIATSFITTDIPIHCIIALNSAKAATVKMNLVAVNANGIKPETNVVVISYKTNGKQNRVKFNASPEGVWSAGKYRIDILIEGKLAKSQTFEIQKSAKEVENEKQTPPKSKPKTKQRTRKN